MRLYLAPVPFRGKRNQPAYVPHVAAEIARLRGIVARGGRAGDHGQLLPPVQDRLRGDIAMFSDGLRRWRNIATILVVAALGLAAACAARAQVGAG